VRPRQVDGLPVDSGHSGWRESCPPRLRLPAPVTSSPDQRGPNARYHERVTHADSPTTRTQPYTWSPGTWFGPLFGCTVWMVALSMMTFRLDATAGTVVLVAYLVANALGIVLWSRRATLRPQVAFQIQLGVTFVLALFSVAVVDYHVDLASLEGGFSTWQIYATLIVYPMLMFMFWRRDRAAQRAG
jgi:hypothetical protein